MTAARPTELSGPPPPPLPQAPGRWLFRLAEDHGPDLERVVRWMRAPHVARYWEQPWDAERWAEEIARQKTGRHSRPVLALDCDTGDPVAYLELYRVCRDRIAPLYRWHEHDLGLHLAIGDPARTGQGLGRALLRAAAEGMLAADPACRRVVAEPDIGNEPSLRAFSAAGFVPCATLDLPEKTAVLMVRPRTREDLPR